MRGPTRIFWANLTPVSLQCIGLAASFNRSAWTAVGYTASTELRLGVNTGICLEGAAQRCSGLSVFIS